jgi:hypothetical protein
MEEHEPVEKKKNHPCPPRGAAPKKRLTFTLEERLRAVKLHLEEGFNTTSTLGQL